MKALLQAYASAWSKAGLPHIAALVGAIDTPEHLAVADHQVPGALAEDYDRAIASLTRFPVLQRQLLRTGGSLPWMQGNMQMPETFQGRFAYVELAGPKGMIANADVRFGLYLQQHNTVYPSHWHRAVEDYLVLSGTALWQVDDGAFMARPPGAHIQHGSNQPHATTTREDPLLAMWFWQGDIRVSTYRIVGVDT
ncbi:MAG: dimethylsulfonioproprionate lyase family protein [Anderseniella sp.]